MTRRDFTRMISTKVKNLEILAETISQAEYFNMEQFVTPEGKPSDIAGWALYLADPDDPIFHGPVEKVDFHLSRQSRAAEWMGISMSDFTVLWSGSFIDKRIMNVSKHDVLEQLRGMIHYNMSKV